MPKIILVMLLMKFTALVNAQISNPVKWTQTAVKIADKIYELHLTASIDGNWHMYAQDAGEGPEPTTINFTPNPLVSFDGKVKEVGKLEKLYEKYFKSVSKYYETKVDFVQKIKVKSSIATVVKGKITYVVCNDRQCLPPKEVPFSINVGGK
jgi:thiol:disulfide interchange protein DsbD